MVIIPIILLLKCEMPRCEHSLVRVLQLLKETRGIKGIQKKHAKTRIFIMTEKRKAKEKRSFGKGNKTENQRKLLIEKKE